MSREVKIALICTAVVLTALLGFQAITGEATRSDFQAIYAAAWAMDHGGSARLYDVKEQARVQEFLFGRPGVLPFIHPPFEAVLFRPIARLPYPSAYFVWGLINSALWFWSVRKIQRFVNPDQPFRFLILCFGLFPLWIALLQGSTSFLVLTAYILAYSAIVTEREFRAGMLLGIGLFRFQLVLPFVLICALREKWKIVAGFVSAGLLLGVFSAAVIGTTGVSRYLSVITGITTAPEDPIQASIPYSSMISLRGLLTVVLAHWLPAQWINVATVFASMSLIMYVGWHWRCDDRNGSERQPLLFAAAAATSIVGGFYALGHDLTVALLPIGLAFNAKRPNVVLRTSIALLYTLPIIIVLGAAGNLYLMCPVLVAFVVGLVMRCKHAESV